MKDVLLSVRKLSVRFQLPHLLIKAVNSVSFDLREGEILGIVGESGCGKSALAKALLQLLPSPVSLLSGQAFYEGQNLIEMEEKELQKVRGKEIGFIFQDPMTSLNPTMKIGKQIAESYSRHFPSDKPSLAKARALELLEMVGIAQPHLRYEDYPHSLSGGMRQRVMIASALAARPKLIIADEPTTALDVTIQAQILELMKQIKEKLGTSMILISHDLSVVAGYCDRVMVMYAGQIVEEASVEKLFASPSHPYTQGLLQSIPRLDMPQDQLLIPVEGSPPSLSEEQKGCSFCPRCRYAMKICAIQRPALIESSPEHRTSCFKVEHERTI